MCIKGTLNYGDREGFQVVAHRPGPRLL